jgi:hypothetical protein
MRTQLKLTLVLGLTLAYPSIAAAKDVRLRQECTRDRCVYYQGSTRVGSVEKEYDTNRLVVREGGRDIVAKVTRDDDGTLQVKTTDRKRKDR